MAIGELAAPGLAEIKKRREVKDCQSTPQGKIHALFALRTTGHPLSDTRSWELRRERRRGEQQGGREFVRERSWKRGSRVKNEKEASDAQVGLLCFLRS